MQPHRAIEKVIKYVGALFIKETIEVIDVIVPLVALFIVKVRH